MKKSVMTLVSLLAVSAAVAGGKFIPATPAVASITKPCLESKVFVDTVHHLMWQDAPYTDSEDGAYARERSLGKAGNWGHAVNYCRSLNYAGHRDWRLPTVDELETVHRLEGQVFTYFRDKDFWTSTPTTEGKYYVIYPADAYRYKRSPRQSNYIRCVRCNKN